MLALSRGGRRGEDILRALSSGSLQTLLEIPELELCRGEVGDTVCVDSGTHEEPVAGWHGCILQLIPMPLAYSIGSRGQCGKGVRREEGTRLISKALHGVVVD